MNLFNSDKINAMNVSPVTANMGLTDSSVDMVTGVPVAEVPTEGGIWDRTKQFVGDNKEMVALAAISVGIGGYLYYQHKKEKAALAALNSAMEKLGGDLGEAVKASPKPVKTPPMGDIVSEQ